MKDLKQILRESLLEYVNEADKKKTESGSKSELKFPLDG